MNKTQLYEAMSFIDDKYIAESMTPYKKKIPRWLKSAVGTAACLIIAVGIALFPYLRPKNDANDIGGNMEPAPNAPDDSGNSGWGDSESSPDGFVGATDKIESGESAGIDLRVTLDSYTDGLARLKIQGERIDALAILATFSAGGESCIATYNIGKGELGAKYEDYADRSELMVCTLEVSGGEYTLILDLTRIYALCDNPSVTVIISGKGYELVPKG